ncbi:hypothetical protein QTG54_001480 [Skeletonema marinoi]|uniref:RGS domain-containing protein n=1 Tax=Skeletonema marinoi TaxID=267567 RepID=A0AAD8YLK3_9STRA|nr:hypothetical protein QTG54_001480 [Skeletonema marinoi]
MMKTQLLVKVAIAALIAIPTLVLVVAFALTGDSGNLLATDFDQCNSEPTSTYIFLTPVFGAALALLATILIRKAQDELDELGLRTNSSSYSAQPNRWQDQHSLSNDNETGAACSGDDCIWDAGLCILLSTQEGINAFSQHCAREFSSENVRFWVAVNEYKAKFDEESCPLYSTVDVDTDDDEAETSDAAVSDLKKAIDSRILCKETFDACQKEIFGVMSRDSYPRYLGVQKRQKR